MLACLPLPVLNKSHSSQSPPNSPTGLRLQSLHYVNWAISLPKGVILQRLGEVVGCHTWGGEGRWCLAGRGQGCRCTPCMGQDSPHNKEAPGPKCPQSRGWNSLLQQTVEAFILSLCFWQKDKSKTKPVLQAHTWSLLFSSSQLNSGLEKITGSWRPSLSVPLRAPPPPGQGLGRGLHLGREAFQTSGFTPGCTSCSCPFRCLDYLEYGYSELKWNWPGLGSGGHVLDTPQIVTLYSRANKAQDWHPIHWGQSRAARRATGKSCRASPLPGGGESPNCVVSRGYLGKFRFFEGLCLESSYISNWGLP